MITTDVLVVGGGPTGLTAANLLARAGVDFRLIDAKTGPVAETRAVVVHARTLELLAKLDLAERAIANGRRLATFELFSGGRSFGTTPVFDGGDGRTPYPYALIHDQTHTERLLLSGLDQATDSLAWSTTLVSLEATPSNVHAVVRRADGREEKIEAGWVIGADGAHSPVRRALGLGFAGTTYQQTAFLADVALEGTLPSGEGTLELTTKGFFAYFPMSGEGRFRLVGTLPSAFAGRTKIASGEVQEIIDQHSVLRPRVRQVYWASVYRTHHRMAKLFRVGRVFLAGDSAHIHSPAGGQGMNTGIGDAYNLAWKLALVAKGQAHVSLLDSYEAERMPFARSILNGTDRGFHLVDTTNPITQQLKLRALPLLFNIVSRTPPLRRRAAWFISQLWTSYRDSPAVTETGPVGRLPRAGDRAPYGFFNTGLEAGTSIFALLTGTDHHLLLFDGLRPDDALTDAAQGTIEALLDRVAAPVRLHRIGAEQRQLQALHGADVPTVVLVRPDGHIAYRGDAGDVVALKRYLDGVFGERANAVAAP